MHWRRRAGRMTKPGAGCRKCRQHLRAQRWAVAAGRAGEAGVGWAWQARVGQYQAQAAGSVSSTGGGSTRWWWRAWQVRQGWANSRRRPQGQR